MSARLYQQRARAYVEDLRAGTEKTRRVIEDSRKLLDRLAAKSGAILYVVPFRNVMAHVQPGVEKAISTLNKS
ncbi:MULTISPECIES: hypothetical protein [unclassified Mesorhizobium]|uniref:hypothetical protein n=1 Tax=unclassified Mesorhizobium TaxID=325217 RepID=UPI00112D0680|nr:MULTISPECIES: hypothetical protein [unclassified Mesorhizobium]MBZ9739729.1 hypothetical protein [Mesorhizobium sp. CO1-1-4]MBZ9805007.1 hypothetical protein [Mesorhizobium sp. ES1-6]TPL88747.1 hypothetical protein FJ948_21345 [Mesorhizobium sp. B2-3-12]